jgi:hypothetical protein
VNRSRSPPLSELSPSSPLPSSPPPRCITPRTGLPTTARAARGARLAGRQRRRRDRRPRAAHRSARGDRRAEPARRGAGPDATATVLGAGVVRSRDAHRDDLAGDGARRRRPRPPRLRPARRRRVDGVPVVRAVGLGLHRRPPPQGGRPGLRAPRGVGRRRLPRGRRRPDRGGARSGSRGPSSRRRRGAGSARATGWGT